MHPNLTWKQEWSAALKNALTGSPEQPWNLSAQDGIGDLSISAAYLVWFSNLQTDTALAIANRLHFSNQMVSALKASLDLNKNYQALQIMTPSEFTAIMQNTPEIALYALDCLHEESTLKTQIFTYLKLWRSLEPFSTGETLKSMGIPPGPRYASILKELKHARLDGRFSTQDQEQAYLDQLIQNL